MPWSEVTVKEQREAFIRDYRPGYYSVSELAERFCISRKTTYKWFGRWEEGGKSGLADENRWPRSCPWPTEAKVRDDLLRLRISVSTP